MMALREGRVHVTQADFELAVSKIQGGKDTSDVSAAKFFA